MCFEPLRETESVSMFKNNEVATPVRVTSFNSTGGKAEPTIAKDYSADTGAGKKEDQRDPELAVYAPNSLNVS